MPPDLSAHLEAVEGRTAEEVLAWAARTFAPKITFATGFGVEGCVLIDIVGRLRLPVDLFTLDTGLLFPETYELWKRLEDKYPLRIRPVRTQVTLEQQAQQWGDTLWERQPDRCCELRKVIPLRDAVRGFDAWVSAIRRDQTRDRADARVVEWDPKFQLIKINPLVRWTQKDIWDYVFAHQVPYNPLHDQGFPSIGCQPCTTAVKPGEDPRAGRWRGQSKNECGLHAKGGGPHPS